MSDCNQNYGCTTTSNLPIMEDIMLLDTGTILHIYFVFEQRIIIAKVLS